MSAYSYYSCFGTNGESTNSIPVFDGGGPGRPQKQNITIPPNEPVYSVYSGEVVGYGGVPVGTPGDAPPGHANFGKNFHAIQFYNGAFMTHGFNNRFR